MLIAISGSQGSGKSTILRELKHLGFNVVERKTARSVLAEYPGKTLDDIYADPKLTVEWQMSILSRKISDEIEAIESEKLWFTERTYADLFVYAVMAVGKNNEYSNWVDEYYRMCQDFNKGYVHTFYVRGGFFTPENDGVRGINKYYSRMIDTTMFDTTERMIDSQRLTFIETADLDQRLNCILSQSFVDINNAVQRIRNTLLEE